MPSEFALIDRYFKRATPRTVLGPGDDCAIVRPAAGMDLLVSTDMLVAGTHFLSDTDPVDLGWKTLAVNVSDLAAMGAQPRWALLAAALPEADEPWLARFAQGLFECADAYEVDMIGGDTTRGPMNFCVTIFGEAPAGQALLRSGAHAGDDVWISGEPGLAALGLAHIQRRANVDVSRRDICLRALLRPQPRLTLGLALRGLASAAIDVSDGLLADLGHILEESGLAATLRFEQLPQAALQCGADRQVAEQCLLAGGDDYELLFCAAPAHRAKIEAIAPRLGLALSRIGEAGAGPAGHIELLDANGASLAIRKRGYDHFD